MQVNLDHWIQSTSERAFLIRDEQRKNVTSALIQSNLDELLVRYLSTLPGCNNSSPGLAIENREEFQIADEGAYAGLIGIEPWLHDRIVLYHQEFRIITSREFTPVQIGIAAHETFAVWYRSLPEHLKVRDFTELALAVSLETDHATVLLKYNPAQFFSG